MAECLFCKIVNKEISSEIVNETDDIVVFKDIKPKTPIHLLIVPKKHIASINDILISDTELMGKLIYRAKEMAIGQGLAERGYRLVFNCGYEGGQVVYHIHLHLLGGKKLEV